MSFIKTMLLIFLIAFSPFLTADTLTYSARLCKETDHYQCYITKSGETWATLFPNATERDIIRKLNRRANELVRGTKVAIPVALSHETFFYAPFAKKIPPAGYKTIFVSLDHLAWGAYDLEGNLVRWGKASGGRAYCPSVKRACETVTGKYIIYRKAGAKCVSRKYPIGKGGAPMPYCMFFHGGFAIHGSADLPGHHASHGCVRIMVEDAQWLNEEFVINEKVQVIVSKK